MYTEMQQQCDTEAAAVMALDAEKMRMSLIPQTDSEYARSIAFIHSLTSIMHHGRRHPMGSGAGNCHPILKNGTADN